MVDGANREQGKGWVRPLILSVSLALVAFYVATCFRIMAQSRQDEARHANVILVFGAAEYAGRPSPIFRARLDHAFGLFEKKLAPMIIVTGGAGGDAHFTEGTVGRDYLISLGVPERRLIAETQGDNTSESSERIAVIMRANGWKSAIAVSDDYHLFRIKRMLQSEGIDVYVSPRPNEVPVSHSSRALTVMREALSYLLWTLHIT